MSKFLAIAREDGSALPLRVKRCDTFACRLRGLTFRKHLDPEEALLFIESSASRMGAAIHMMFVFFPIGVIWLDEDGSVVDAKIARPFRPVYVPQAPARYFLEGAPEIINSVAIGEGLHFIDER